MTAAAQSRRSPPPSLDGIDANPEAGADADGDGSSDMIDGVNDDADVQDGDEDGRAAEDDDEGSASSNHNGEGRRFMCKVCKRRFWRKTHLTRHSKAHQGKYEHHCVHCGKSFYRRDQYSVHLRSHTGERPYACTFPSCGKRFTQKGALTRHERIHQR